MYPNATVAHLPFFKLDHRPLLIHLNMAERTVQPDRPFRFIAAWVLHAEFDGFVKQTWRQDISWLQNMSQFTQACSKWNMEVFRHTERRKKHLLLRLDGINRSVSRYGMRPDYENLQLSIWKELEDVLLQESLIWEQKARVEWSVYGDHNTRYFHARANLEEKLKELRLSKMQEEHGYLTSRRLKAWLPPPSLTS